MAPLPRRSATRIAATTFAPEDVPANRASSRARRRVIAFASSVGTGTISSTSDGSQSGGTAPIRIEAEAYNTGGQNVGYWDSTAGNAGGALRGDDVDIKVSREGGYAVGWMTAGEWLAYTVTVPVVDRGPYIAGREFDLSPRVKAALGCTDLCTVLMQIQ